MSTLAIILTASATAFFAGATFFLKWHTDRPRLHVDDWTIHEAIEFRVQKPTIITELHWGVNFTVKHSAGIPAELFRVEVEAQSPFVAMENHRFDPVTPNRTVSHNTPYRSNVYNIDPKYTLNKPPLKPAVLVVVTITYSDDRLFTGRKCHTATFRGMYSVGDIDNGMWYIRAEAWDAAEEVHDDPQQHHRPGSMLRLQ